MQSRQGRPWWDWAIATESLKTNFSENGKYRICYVKINAICKKGFKSYISLRTYRAFLGFARCILSVFLFLNKFFKRFLYCRILLYFEFLAVGFKNVSGDLQHLERLIYNPCRFKLSCVACCLILNSAFQNQGVLSVSLIRN